MKQRILSGWNFQRALFLILGITVLVQSSMEQQWMGAIFGGYFAAMGLFSFGCAAGGCYGGNCYTKPQQKNKNDIEDVNFEEIKQK
jgi:hypothetical protein